MTRIFLVEDEVYALRVLEQKINDLDGPFEIVGTASNGTEALDKIAEARPSVLMTDIRMPDMDGITLIEELQKRGYGDILPVIISGYQEFEYAKQAVRLSVQDYLLKPVDINELRSCLDACVVQLQKYGRKGNAVSLLIGEENVSLELLPEQYEYVVAYAIMGNALTSYENIIHPNIPYMTSGEIEGIVGTAFPPAAVCHCFDGFFSNEKVLVLGAEAYSEESFTAYFEKAVEILRNRVGSYITLQFARVNSQETVASSIRACHREAVHRLEWGASQVACNAAKPYKRDGNLKEHVELFQMLLRQNDASLLRSNVIKMFAQWRQAGHTAMPMQEDMILLLGSLYNRLAQGKATTSVTFYVENLVCFSSTLLEIQENFTQLLLELFGTKSTDTKGASSHELVARTVQFFENNLHTNLTLQMVTSELGISKVYLCRIFKKHKNVTPIDYFTNMKIEKAKGLIQQFPGMPLREIADQLGFADIYYFSKVYKRVTGRAPSEERNQ